MAGNTNIDAVALLNSARRFYKLAEIGFGESDADLEQPLYFLYFQVVENLLKSYLAARGKNPRSGHKITQFYRQAEELGLTIEGDPYELQNVVSLLESGNQNSGFRYLTSDSGSIPELRWTRDVVGRLLTVVATLVEPISASLPSTPVKLRIKFSKPA